MMNAAFSLQPPAKWVAGYIGEGETRRPFHFNCAQCRTEEPEIAGIYAKAVEQPKFTDVLILGDLNTGLRPAMFCAKCWPEALAASKESKP